MEACHDACANDETVTAGAGIWIRTLGARELVWDPVVVSGTSGVSCASPLCGEAYDGSDFPGSASMSSVPICAGESCGDRCKCGGCGR